MNKLATIFLGLPLSGKSTYIENRLQFGDWSEEIDIQIVSADTIKEGHPEYNPIQAYKIHEWSVNKAETKMKKYSDMGVSHIVMDGGGINNSYTIRIINMLKDKGYEIELIHVKTPLQVCLFRNENRERKVPVTDIIIKAAKERNQFLSLKEYADKVTIVPYFTNKHIFIDMDGVIAGQSILPEYEGKIDFVNSKIFSILPPVWPVIDKLNSLDQSKHNLYILSATPNSFSYDEKHEWLDKYFPIPKDKRFFVNSGQHKALMLENLRTHLKADKRDMTLIEDTHSTLKKVSELRMNPIHVSEFLSDDFLKDEDLYDQRYYEKPAYAN